MQNSETFELLIHKIRKHLSETLCPEEYYSQICLAAAQIPALSQGMLEFRLLGADSRVDFGVLLIQEKGEMDLLLDFHRNYGSRSLRLRNAWKRILRFCQKCVKKGGFLNENVNNIWVAYDLGTSPVPIPWIYIGIRPYRGFPELSADQCRKILTHYDIRITKDQYSIMTKLLRALPLSAQMEAFGYLEIRSLKVLRIISKSFNHSKSINAYLHEIDWPSRFDGTEALEFLLLESDQCQLVFDIGETLLPRIGVEFWYHRANTYAKSEMILQRLVSFGLCKPEFIDPLLKWVTRTEAKNDRDVDRWINHIKLTFEEGKPLVPKLYLSFQRLKS